jgi:hypothetical protein
MDAWLRLYKSKQAMKQVTPLQYDKGTPLYFVRDQAFGDVMVEIQQSPTYSTYYSFYVPSSADH